MKERQILFSDLMVRALLDGTKSQTRRIAKVREYTPSGPLQHAAQRPRPYLDSYCGEQKTNKNLRGMSDRWYWWTEDNRPDLRTGIRCPYGQPGDLLYVREAWGLHARGDETDWERGSVRGCTEGEIRGQHDLTYRADWGGAQEGCYWRPGIYLPRWASRITLELTSVRVERLQDISEADARAEGVTLGEMQPAIVNGEPGRVAFFNARDAFAYLWAAINGAESWKANSWVWVLGFTRVERR